MPVPTSALFDFLGELPSCSIDRHELVCRTFSDLRRRVRRIVTHLHEADDAESSELADALRAIISEWLTVPVRFDGAMLHELRTMGDPRAVELRWGRDVRLPYEEATRCANELRTIDNPMRAFLSRAVAELQASGTSFRVYCHPQAVQHFQGLNGGPQTLGAEHFVHSVAQYRDVPPFDVLIKVGPLRARGWGSAPDAILTAPRFRRLVQPVWGGCADEPSFGYDPVSALLLGNGGSEQREEGTARLALGLRIEWRRDGVVSVNADLGPADVPDVPDEDDFEIYRQLERGGELRPATLLQLHDEHGMLVSPRARMLSFDPNITGGGAIDRRLPDETLLEGMYVILPALDDASLGGSRAEDGRYSSVWKRQLSEEISKDSAGLVRRLWAAGVELRGLRTRVEHWRRPASVVIHAPQQAKHFEALMRVLDCDLDAMAPDGARHGPGWRHAWDEVRRARGEAVQSGMVEHSVVDEALVSTLQSDLTALRSAAAAGETFERPLADKHGLEGVVRLMRVRSIESGFQVPAGEMGVIIETATVNQWRS